MPDHFVMHAETGYLGLKGFSPKAEPPGPLDPPSAAAPAAPPQAPADEGEEAKGTEEL